MCLNGYMVTKVIHFTRKFGQFEDDEIEEPLIIKSSDYVEVVKLNGDLDVPAGQME